MLLWLLGAGVLPAACLSFAWRISVKVRAAATSTREEPDALERSLLERESNLALNLARRNLQALGRVSLFGGTGLGIGALTGGREYDIAAGTAFALGVVGWLGCGELRRRVGSLAEAWRAGVNRRRRRQGVDHPERTG